MVNYKKRLLAYTIDILILGVIIAIVGYIIPESLNIRVLNNELSNINEMFLNHTINIAIYLKRYAIVLHSIDIERAIYGIINSFFIILYFVIYPYFKNGSTFGQSVVKIKVVGEDNELPTLNNLLWRNIIINGLGYMLISLALLYVVPSLSYFIIVSILGFLQLMVVIISIFMVIYRKDKQGLQDIYSNTFVVEDK